MDGKKQELQEHARPARSSLVCCFSAWRQNTTRSALLRRCSSICNNIRMAPRSEEESSGATATQGRPNFITHMSMDEETDASKFLYGNPNISDDPEGNTGFIRYFITSSGPPQIITLCLLLALALGSTVGVVPSLVEDRFARLNHGYEGVPCLQLKMSERPQECLLGNDDAQNAAAL